MVLFQRRWAARLGWLVLVLNWTENAFRRFFCNQVACCLPVHWAQDHLLKIAILVLACLFRLLDCHGRNCGRLSRAFTLELILCRRLHADKLPRPAVLAVFFLDLESVLLGLLVLNDLQHRFPVFLFLLFSFSLGLRSLHLLWRLLDLLLQNLLVRIDCRGVLDLSIDVDWWVLFDHYSEEFVEVVHTEVLPSFRGEHLDELVLVPAVVKQPEHRVFEVIHHGLESWLVSLYFAGVDSVVDFGGRVFYDIIGHLFHDSRCRDHETQRCFQVFVRD